MKTAGISEIKQEMQHLSAKEIAVLCLRLAKFKKENKELLNYLLFKSHDLQSYTENIKNVVEEEFKEVNKTNLYFAKKNLRRILRYLNKHIKYVADKQFEASLLIHFCKLVKASGIQLKKSTALQNLYAQQLKKIKAAISSLHEDLQYDMLKEFEILE
ncbi:MAG: hypothetical protein V4556_04970 [Bacteroidota bacterium]